MKIKWSILLLTIVYLVSAPVCAVLAITDLGVLALCLPALPAFCSQLLLCELSKKTWVRCLPLLPVLILLGFAGFYLIRDDGWDRLAALIFGLAGIAPAVGTGLGWGVWYLNERRERKAE